MSEQKESYMQQLDAWTQAVVIEPLADVDPLESTADVEAWAQLVAQVKKAIRQKVLESYRNGQEAGAKPVRKEPQYAKPKNR